MAVVSMKLAVFCGFHTPSVPYAVIVDLLNDQGELQWLVAYTLSAAVVAGQHQCPQGMACVSPRYSVFLRTSAPPGDR